MTPTPPLALSTIQLVHLDELVALQIRNTHGEALIALQGAQVLQYTPKGQKPLIWLSEQAQFKQGRSVRGGIPDRKSTRLNSSHVRISYAVFCLKKKKNKRKKRQRMENN